MLKSKEMIVVLALALFFLSGCSMPRNEKALAAEKVEDAELEKTGQVQAATDCTLGAAWKYAVKQLGLRVDGSGYGAYRRALVEAGVLEPDGVSDARMSLIKGELALLASGVMRHRGEGEDKALSSLIRTKKRISDLKKTEEAYQKAVVHVFSKGVMVGSSNGAFSQSREFRAGEAVTPGVMKSVMKKAVGTKERSIMSPDGQLTRTTKLPKNYKKYRYILASFPNSYYEMKNKYENTKYYFIPEELEDYAYPRDLSRISYFTGYETLMFPEMYERYGEEWLKKIKDNLTCRLNFDYRKIDDQWVESLASTYYIEYGKTKNEAQIKDIKEYVKTAKKNRVVVKADRIVVEPSSMYMEGGEFFVRCYLRFKVSADEVYAADSFRQSELIYCNHGDRFVWLKYLKPGKWYEGYYDVGIGGTAYGDSGYGFSIIQDILTDTIVD